jgi:hypothetical protein
MDKAALVGADLQAGRHIVESLESLNIPVDVAAWLQDDETGDWWLVLSSPALARAGSMRVNDAVVSIVRNLDDADIDLDNVRVLSPNNGIIQDLKHRVWKGDDLQVLRLDGLNLGGQPFRAARIYRVTGGHRSGYKIEYGAHVRVKATGQLGTVHGIVRTPQGPRYLVLFDIGKDDVQPLGEKPRAPVGQDYAAGDLDLLYVVRSSGWPERTPQWLADATGVSTFAGTSVAPSPDRT